MLAQAALLASGRAMKRRLWAEAKALTGLAESYRRLENSADAGTGPGRYSLSDMMEAMNDPNSMIAAMRKDPQWRGQGEARWDRLMKDYLERTMDTGRRIIEAATQGRRAVRVELGLPPDPPDETEDPDHPA